MWYYVQIAGGAVLATLGGEAALARTPGPSSGSQARLGGHATSGRRAPGVTVTHHPAPNHASRPSGASSLAAPHVPAVVPGAGLSLSHRPRLLLLHVQTHLAAEHDWLKGEGNYTVNAHWATSNGKSVGPRPRNTPNRVYSLACNLD